MTDKPDEPIKVDVVQLRQAENGETERGSPGTETTTEINYKSSGKDQQ